MPSGLLRRDIVPATGLGLLFHSFVTVERMVVTDGGFDRLYGFPAEWTVNAYYSSMAFDIFILPLLADVIVYVGIAFLLIALFRTIFGLKRRTSVVVTIMSLLLNCAIIGLQSLVHMEGRIRLQNNTDYMTTEQHMHFGIHP